MKTCYFCTTPFQIISSISMANSFREEADLYIIDQFKGANKMGMLLEESGIFQNVVVQCEKDIINTYINVRKEGGLYNHFKIAKSYLHVDQIAKQILICDASYEKMYISSKSYIARLIMLYFIKHKAKIEIIYFDDCEGSYYNPKLYTPSKGDSIIRKIIFGNAANDTDKKRILYSPELYYKLNPDSTAIVEQMPCLWQQKSVKDVINKMFEFKLEDKVHEKVILLDILKEVLSDDEQIRYTRCCNYINSVFHKENIIVKKHPRDNTENSNFTYYHNSSIPFEVLALNSDISNKIIITYASTGAITPKQIFDKEPIVILLYKLIKKENTNSKFLAYYEACKNLYVSDRFFIPETEEELTTIIERLLDCETNGGN